MKNLQKKNYFLNNVKTTKNILLIMNKLKVNNIIYSSTAAVYDKKDIKIKENSKLNPINKYGYSKLNAEKLIKCEELNYIIFRFFNVSGSDGIHRQLGPASHLIRRAAMVAVGSLSHVEVFGDDYNTRDGTCVRDYIHVTDVCNSIIRAIERGPANTDYECLGSQSGFSVLDVIAAMRNATGQEIPIRSAPRRAGDAESCIVDKLSDLCKLTKSLEDMCFDQYKLELTNKYH